MKRSMLSPLAALLLASSPTQAAHPQPSSADDCSDIRHVELHPPVLSPPRICVSPGVLTGILFDQPVDVSLQEEVHFAEVIRGRRAIGVIPPPDMLPEAPLRLTAVYGAGEARQSLTLVLVAHPGQGSHQVEVSYTAPSLQAMSNALGQALLTNRSLGEENTSLKEEVALLRERLDQPRGLSEASAGGQLGRGGIAAHGFSVAKAPGDALRVVDAISYRGHTNVAVEFWVVNVTREPWNLEKATLVTEQGQMLEALRFQQAKVSLPDEGDLLVFVEFDPGDRFLGSTTLTLIGTGGRVQSFSNVVFPMAELLVRP